MSAFAAYKTLLPYIKRYWKQYCGGLLCLLVIIGGQLLVPQFIRVSIDTLIGDGDSIVRTLIGYMGQLVGITVIIATARFGWRHFLAITARKIETELRSNVYAKITTLSHDFYATHSTGDIIARLTNDLNAVRMACGFAVVSIVDGFVMSIAIVALLFWRYPQLTLYMLAPLPLISILVFYSGKVIVKRYAKVQQAFSTLTEKARHALTNMKTIKAYGKERHFEEKFTHHANVYKTHSLAYARFWSLVFPMVLFLATCSNLLLIIFGGREVLRGTITIGDFVSIMTYLEMLLWPMIGLGFTMNIFAQGAASLKRINEFQYATPLIKSKRNALPLGQGVDIELRGLDYAYPGRSERALSGISLTIGATAHIGITGRTASGKSTLAQLLPRLLEAPPNTILINGTDIRTYKLEELRKKICLVPQQPFLFSENIKHNILFGIDDEDDADGGDGPDDAAARFAEIIDAAAIDAGSPEFPSGLNTEIGENGIMISGGQKQRIAIARALITDPIMTIFDDTFSALDAETEQRVMEKVRMLRKGKATVFISNRVQSIARCDAIYVLSEGVLIQQGSYQSLVAQDGLFRNLYHMQVPTKLEHEA